jgi:hypothetical protein
MAGLGDTRGMCRDPAFAAVLEKAGLRGVARAANRSPGSVAKWRRVPRELVADVARGCGLRPEDVRPDLAAVFQAERLEQMRARAIERFALSSGMAVGTAKVTRQVGGEAATVSMDLLDLGLVMAAMRFAAEECGLSVAAVIGARPGAGGAATPELSARARGAAQAVVVCRVSSAFVASLLNVSRQAVDNAAERYLRARDGDDPETVEDGHVIERGRRRLAKMPDDALWAAEARFLARLEGAA